MSIADHLTLVLALSRVSPPWSARQQRQIAIISEFTYDIRHMPGAANVVADTFSRPPPPSPPSPQFPLPSDVTQSEMSDSSVP